MKKYLFIGFMIVGIQATYSQEANSNLKQNIDSISLWEYCFLESNKIDNKIGSLILRRTKDIYSEDSSISITPQITFDIYPISFADSIKNIESSRRGSLSCCYPKCGSTIETTLNFIFWSDPWSITSAIECNGVDYTRKNVEVILGYVKNKNFYSIKDLLIELPIKKTNN